MCFKLAYSSVIPFCTEYSALDRSTVGRIIVSHDEKVTKVKRHASKACHHIHIIYSFIEHNRQNAIVIMVDSVILINVRELNKVAVRLTRSGSSKLCLRGRRL